MRLDLTKPLTGRLILIVEDNPLIALDMEHAFEEVGASVLRARTVGQAMLVVADRDLSAAVIDYGLGDSTAKEICHALEQRCIPFVVYSGYSEVDKACHSGVFVPKPASSAVLVTTVAALLPQPSGPPGSEPLAA